jgi:hypothetical protein
MGEFCRFPFLFYLFRFLAAALAQVLGSDVWVYNKWARCGRHTSRMQMYSPRDSPINSSSRPEPKSRPVIVIAKQNCGTTRRAIMIMIPYRLYLSGASFPEHLTINFSPLILHPDGRCTPYSIYEAYACMRARSLKMVALCALRHGII